MSEESSTDRTSSASALLQVCLQDLASGYRLLGERLPGVADCARNTELSDALATVVAGAAARLQRMSGLGWSLDGPENIWMGGILDDAERDTQTILPGDLLDIAMIGAVRKALAAEQVSVETAIVLSDRLNEADTLRALQKNVDKALEEDARLQRLLVARTAV